MDEERVEELGASPLAGELSQIDEVTDVSGLVRVLGTLERAGAGSVFGVYIAPDRGRPDRYIVHVSQSGIGLPDESYYREDAFAPVREAYVAHIASMLALAGFDDAEARASRVMDLETRIASHHWDRVACRDTQKTYNLLDGDALQALAPPFDFDTWTAAAGIPASALAEVIVSQPSFLEGLTGLLVDGELEAWRDWLRWNVVHGAAPYLSERVRRGELRLLRKDAERHRRVAPPLEARGRIRRGRHG